MDSVVSQIGQLFINPLLLSSIQQGLQMKALQHVFNKDVSSYSISSRQI
jgi:hypothetical protein